MRVVYGARVQSRIVRIAEDAVTSYAIPAVGEYVLGEDWAYTTDGQTPVAFDPVKGTVQWTLRRPHLDLRIGTFLASRLRRFSATLGASSCGGSCDRPQALNGVGRVKW